MKKAIAYSCFAMLLVLSACVVAPGPYAPVGYYPGPYVAQPVVYGGGYYYHRGYGYYR